MEFHFGRPGVAGSPGLPRVALPFDPRATYAHLDASGAITQVPGGAAFWSLPEAEMTALGSAWMISEYEFTADWPTWEMHPHGDEFVYLLAGSIELLLDEAAGVRSHSLQGGGAVIVPQGVWHTARVRAPSRMLHVTPGAGTQHRPTQPEGPP